MKLFNIFKKSEPQNALNNNPSTNQKNQYSVIEFDLKNVDPNLLSKIEIEDYVSLWTKDHLDYINIYASGHIGGDGKIGQIPNEFYLKIKDHLNSKPSFLNSGPSSNNYEALIKEIQDNTLKISLTLIPNEILIQEHENYLEKIVENLKTELAKPKVLKKPIELKFHRENGVSKELPEVSLNLPTKEAIYSNPNNIEFQLINLQKEVVARSISQRKEHIEIIRAFDSNNITNVSVNDDNDSVVIVTIH